MSYIGKLYQIESSIPKEQIDFAAREELRQKRAKPILDEMKIWLEKSLLQAPPQSAIGKALSYTSKQWEHLCRYIDHGEVEIDNNLVENQIRPFALGRKNWLFAGNERGANMAALFYSLIQSCKLNGINARSYLNYVLNQAGKMSRREINPKILLPQFIDRNLLN